MAIKGTDEVSTVKSKKSEHSEVANVFTPILKHLRTLSNEDLTACTLHINAELRKLYKERVKEFRGTEGRTVEVWWDEGEADYYEGTVNAVLEDEGLVDVTYKVDGQPWKVPSVWIRKVL